MTKLQEILIQKISSTRDKKILQEISRILETGVEDDVYQLNEKQTTAVQEAQEEIKKGQFLSNNEANKQAKEWLKKK
jgi:predicted transcriptional regulator